MTVTAVEVINMIKRKYGLGPVFSSFFSLTGHFGIPLPQLHAQHPSRITGISLSSTWSSLEDGLNMVSTTGWGL